jgi:DNA-binding transcriptional ArsR family regulator
MITMTCAETALLSSDFDLLTMRQAAGQACGLLRVLANPDRLLLLCHLAHQEACVSELETALDIHQPTLSQQLGVLREEGLVSTRREGRQIYYRIDSPQALAVMQSLYQTFCKAAD